MPLNAPNLLTLLRIVLIPLFVGIFYFERSWVSLPNQNLVATVLFTSAAITDWFDGWLARRLQQTSAFGAFLDPVADKLMVAAALIVLLQLGRIDALVALIIIVPTIVSMGLTKEPVTDATQVEKSLRELDTRPAPDTNQIDPLKGMSDDATPASEALEDPLKGLSADKPAELEDPLKGLSKK